MTTRSTQSDPTVPRQTTVARQNRTHLDSSDTRQFQRQAIIEHFLTSLEDVVWRYRALATHAEHADLHAEVVTAEVAHQLEVALGALHRHPALR
jgi:hypothetical protein